MKAAVLKGGDASKWPTDTPTESARPPAKVSAPTPADPEIAATFCLDQPGGGRCAARCGDGHACREGYGCALKPRWGEPDVWRSVCVPGGAAAPKTACQKELAALGVVFRPLELPARSPSGHPELMCEVTEPVMVDDNVHGVTFRGGGGESAPMVMSCQMALAVSRMARVLGEEGIVEVHHMGVYNCRTLRSSPRLSQHAHGAAMDIGGFVTRRGETLSVLRDWERDAIEPKGRRGKALMGLAKRFHEEFVFNIVLTPEYNAGHANHLHVDLSPDKHFLSLGPDQVLMGPIGD